MIQEIVPLRDRRKDFPDHAAMLSGCNLANLAVFLHYLFFYRHITRLCFRPLILFLFMPDLLLFILFFNLLLIFQLFLLSFLFQFSLDPLFLPLF